MNAPVARFRSAVDRQPWDRPELKADVEADRADRRLIPQAGADRIIQIVEGDTPRIRFDGSAVEKEDAAEVADERRTQLRREGEHAVAADRQAGIAEGSHLIASPPANRRRAAEEVLLRKRDERLVAVCRIDISRLRAIRPDEARADREIVPGISGYQPVTEGAGKKAAGLLDVKRHLIAARGVQQVVGSGVLRVEADDRCRSLLEPGRGIEPDRD